MISSLRNFAKTKIAGIFIFIIIIPFVFWGMGSVFNSGNTNNIAKINNTNISTQDFMDYLNQSGLSSEVIQDNLDKNILEELLSALVSTTLLNLEIKDLNITISNDALIENIKTDKNFLDENGIFKRTNYEKFLLLNNQTAPMYEVMLKNRILQKQLFEYIAAGSVAPKFLINRSYKEENKVIDINFIDLNNIYKKPEEFEIKEIKKFLDDNENELKKDYIDFSYIKIEPKNLIGLDEFNETFFKKIDEIENKISKNYDFKSIINEIDIDPIDVTDYTLSKNREDINDKIFLSRKNSIDIIEYNGSYIFYHIKNIESKLPDLKDEKNKKQVISYLSTKKKFEFNKKILDQINNNEFDDNKFAKIGKNFVQKIVLRSINDEKKFEKNSVKILYSLPKNSFTLLSDVKKNVYLAKIVNFRETSTNIDKEEFIKFIDKYKSKNKKNFLISYDVILNDKYKVTVNQKTLDRVKNYFQ